MTSFGSEPLDLGKFVEEFVKVEPKALFYKRNQGFHILFDEHEVKPYFDAIHKSGKYPADFTNGNIWRKLIESLEFNGVDFEKLYKILPSPGSGPEDAGTYPYTFEESIVLSHTLLVAPVVQHYGPLTPKLDLTTSITKKFEKPQQVLAVGMIGDCLKGNFFNDLTKKKEDGDKEAEAKIKILQDPLRLCQKMHGLVRAILQVRGKFGSPALVMDAVLVGSGAFGGTAKNLAQPFVDSLNAPDVPFDNEKDKVNFFIYPPPKEEELTLKALKYNATLNPKQGLGFEDNGNIIHVVLAGFDPVSLAPHGVTNRAYSAEGQMCHATDFLSRVTGRPGKFVNVKVPPGKAWESPQAFFNNEEKYKDEPGYDTVRFVPEFVLETLGVNGQEGQIQLVAREHEPPRAWNGDNFHGWSLSLPDARPCMSWVELSGGVGMPIAVN